MPSTSMATAAMPTHQALVIPLLHCTKTTCFMPNQVPNSVHR